MNTEKTVAGLYQMTHKGRALITDVNRSMLLLAGTSGLLPHAPSCTDVTSLILKS